NTYGNLLFENLTIEKSVNSGVLARSFYNTNPTLHLKNINLINCNDYGRDSAKYGAGFLIHKDSDLEGNDRIGNIILEEFSIIDTKQNPSVTSGVYISGGKP